MDRWSTLIQWLASTQSTNWRISTQFSSVLPEPSIVPRSFIEMNGDNTRTPYPMNGNARNSPEH